MRKASELVRESRFFQEWSGKKQTLPNWFGTTGTKAENSLTIQNTNAKLQKLKTENKDYLLTINEIAQLQQFEPRTLQRLASQGITIQYQKFEIDFITTTKGKNLTIDLTFTHKVHGQVNAYKVNHLDALKQLKNDNINNDQMDIIQRLYQILKD